MCGQVLRRKIVFGLAMLCLSACGTEPAPWSGFPLFPGEVVSVPSAQTDSGRPPGNENTPAAPSGGAVASPPAAGSGSTAVAVAGTAAIATPDTGSVAAAGSGNTVAVTDPAAPRVSDAFRITELYLRDPHLFAGISDLTERPVLNVSINQILIPGKLTMDADHDGFLDVSVIFLMPQSDAVAADATLTIVDGECASNAPLRCKHEPDSSLRATWTIESRTTGTCLAPISGTTSAYQPAITVPSAPCFATSIGEDLVFNLGGVDVPVIGARVGATYRSAPEPALVNGLLAGFVTNTAAMQAQLPAEAGALAPGSSLNSFVKQQDHDPASSPTGEDGFWIYLNFVATRIEYTP